MSGRQLQIAHIGNRVILTVTEPDAVAGERQYDEICRTVASWIDHFLPRPPEGRYAVEARAGNVVVFVRAST